MTQVERRSRGGKGMTQAAWKYAVHVAQANENFFKGREKKEAEERAEARKNITLPRVKWLERPIP